MSQRVRSGPQFLSAWLRNPLQMGAVLPSSDGLASAMAAQADVGSGLTLELGAGTGAVTAALLARGIPWDRLVVVEKDRRLAAALTRRYPTLAVLHGDAARLRQLLHPSAVGHVDNVVSSLPLLSLRSVTRTRVLVGLFSILHPRGKLVQFTYSPKAPIPEMLANALHIRGERVERVLWNLPPANVWVYTRIDEAAATPHVPLA